MAAFKSDQGCAADDMALLNLTKNKLGHKLCAVIIFGNHVPVNENLALLRGLERHLRRNEADIDRMAQREGADMKLFEPLVLAARENVLSWDLCGVLSHWRRNDIGRGHNRIRTGTT